MKARFPAVLFLLFSLPLLIAADFPKPSGYVNDFAGIIVPETKASLETALRDFEKAGGIEIAVVTLPTLKDRTIEDAAARLFQEWGIGKKGKDDGLLLLVAPNERKMRIEVGYGLEETITDATAGRVRDAFVLPAFRAGDMSGGIEQGTLAIAKAIVIKQKLVFSVDSPFDVNVDALRSSGFDSSSFEQSIGYRLALVLIALSLIYAIVGIFAEMYSATHTVRSRLFRLLFDPIHLFVSADDGDSGSGGGFGGFGGFGGGCSGGGGASGGW